VHKHHPPLVYGRTMKGTPESSEGWAMCEVPRPGGGGTAFGVITYTMPNVSARMVPLLQSFCEQYLAGGISPAVTAN
jgi:hypothetical protein